MLFAVVATNCSGEEPTPTPSAIRVYSESIATDRELFNSANTASNETWSTFIDSVESGLLGLTLTADPQASSAADAAASTRERRAKSLLAKLGKLEPPPSCERWHILLEEYADANVEVAQAQQGYISTFNGRQITLDSATTRFNTANSRVSQLIDDLNVAGRLCR